MLLGKALWGLLRPLTYALMAIYAVVGAEISILSNDIAIDTLQPSYYLDFALFIASIGLWYIAGTALNDYADYEIDKINLPTDTQRPAVQGIISRNTLRTIATISSVLGLMLVAGIGNWYVFGLYLTMILLNAAYSIRPIQISRRGLFAQLLLPLGYIALPVLGGYLISQYSLNQTILLFGLGMYIHFIARLLLKDHRDIKGDLKAGKITAVIKYGHLRVTYLATTLYIVSMLMIIASIFDYVSAILTVLMLIFGAALYGLYLLRSAATWSEQRLAIAIFGRMATTSIVLILVALLGHILNQSTLAIQVTAWITGLFMLMSIRAIIDKNQLSSVQDNHAANTPNAK